MGTVRAIWRKRSKGGPMDPLESARLEAGGGLEGNADYGGSRQLTVISEESFRDVDEALGRRVDRRLRRANLLVEGVDLVESRGRILRVGEAEIEIGGETRPCRQMEESCPGLQDALGPGWRGGVWGRVLADGEIAVGDPVRLEPAEELA